MSFNARMVASKLRVLYGALDPAAEKAIASRAGEVSCRGVGCVGCCHQMVGITVPEGLLLARAVLARADWLELARALREACAPLLEPGLTRASYFNRAVPCALLDVASGACRVYAERPAACRYYVVTSPAEDCYPPSGKGTRALNLTHLEAHVFDFNVREMGPQAAACAAPLQLVTLWCMRLMAGKERPELVGIVDGLPDPHEWTRKHAEKLLGDEPMTDKARETLAAMEESR